MKYWREISAFLGFDEGEQELCCRRFWENSLFGGLWRLGNKHVRSGDVAQWKREFTLALAFAFLRRFPGALQSLAYEPDNRCIVDLESTAANDPTSPPNPLVPQHSKTFPPFSNTSFTLSLH